MPPPKSKLPIGTFPKLVPVRFKECGHEGRVFSPNAVFDPLGNLKEKHEETEETQLVAGNCWTCGQLKAAKESE